MPNSDHSPSTKSLSPFGSIHDLHSYGMTVSPVARHSIMVRVMQDDLLAGVQLGIGFKLGVGDISEALLNPDIAARHRSSYEEISKILQNYSERAWDAKEYLPRLQGAILKGKEWRFPKTKPPPEMDPIVLQRIDEYYATLRGAHPVVPSGTSASHRQREPHRALHHKLRVLEEDILAGGFIDTIWNAVIRDEERSSQLHTVAATHYRSCHYLHEKFPDFESFWRKQGDRKRTVSPVTERYRRETLDIFLESRGVKAEIRRELLWSPTVPIKVAKHIISKLGLNSSDSIERTVQNELRYIPLQSNDITQITALKQELLSKLSKRGIKSARVDITWSEERCCYEARYRVRNDRGTHGVRTGFHNTPHKYGETEKIRLPFNILPNSDLDMRVNQKGIFIGLEGPHSLKFSNGVKGWRSSEFSKFSDSLLGETIWEGRDGKKEIFIERDGRLVKILSGELSYKDPYHSDKLNTTFLILEVGDKEYIASLNGEKISRFGPYSNVLAIQGYDDRMYAAAVSSEQVVLLKLSGGEFQRCAIIAPVSHGDSCELFIGPADSVFIELDQELTYGVTTQRVYHFNNGTITELRSEKGGKFEHSFYFPAKRSYYTFENNDSGSYLVGWNGTTVTRQVISSLFNDLHESPTGLYSVTESEDSHAQSYYLSCRDNSSRRVIERKIPNFSVSNVFAYDPETETFIVRGSKENGKAFLAILADGVVRSELLIGSDNSYINNHTFYESYAPIGGVICDILSRNKKILFRFDHKSAQWIKSPKFSNYHWLNHQVDDGPVLVGKEDDKPYQFYDQNFQPMNLPTFEEIKQVAVYEEDIYLIAKKTKRAVFGLYRIFLGCDSEEVKLLGDEKTIIKEMGLVKDPVVKGLKKYLNPPTSAAERLRRYLEGSRTFATLISGAIKEHPEEFKTIPAVYCSTEDTREIVKSLFHRVSQLMSEEERELQRSGILLKLSESGSPLTYQDNCILQGGGELRQDKILRVQEGFHQFAITSFYDLFHPGTNSWQHSKLPFRSARGDPCMVNTIVLHGPFRSGEYEIPHSPSGELLLTRVKGERTTGKRILLEVRQVGATHIVHVKEELKQITISEELPIEPVPIQPIDEEKLKSFNSRIISTHYSYPPEPIAGLSADLEQFLNSIQTADPLSRLKSIRDYVHQVFHYDEAQVVNAQDQSRQSPEEILRAAKRRVWELRADGVECDGKLYAGVCYQAALLGCVLARHSGFLAGLATGYLCKEETVRQDQAHAQTGIVWPHNGEPRLICIEMTPPSASIFSELGEIVDALSVAKNKEHSYTEVNHEINLSEKEILGLSNGKLAHAVNSLMINGVKEANVSYIRRLLDATRWAGRDIWGSHTPKLDTRFTDFLKADLQNHNHARTLLGAEQHTGSGWETLRGTLFDFANGVMQDHNISSLNEVFQQLIKVSPKLLSHLDKETRKIFLLAVRYLGG